MDIIIALIAIAFIAYVIFQIGKKRKATGKFFQDINDNNTPDFLEKKKLKNKKKS